MLRALLSPLVSVPGTPLYGCLAVVSAWLGSSRAKPAPNLPNPRAAPDPRASVAESSAWSGRGWPSSEERG